MLEIIVIVILSLLLIAAIATGMWMVSKLSNLVYDLEEQVEESLDVIDSCYRDIGKVLDTPVFFDDPVVKQTLSSIKKSHTALLMIANKISNFSKKEDEKDS